MHSSTSSAGPAPAARPSPPCTLALLVAALALVAGCTTPHPGPVEDPHEEDPEVAGASRHLAFSGGGWRAHSAHAGTVVGLLGGTGTLDAALGGFETIASNSGGSWFNTMLAYSKPFVDAIEAPDAAQTWTSTGWIGQQRALFVAAGCKDSTEPYDACILEHYGGDALGAVNWMTIVDDLVFKDYPLSGATLSSARQPWARHKTLLLASTMLTQSVVLGYDPTSVDDKTYYQACRAPAAAIPDGDSGGRCHPATARTDVDVVPVTFASPPTAPRTPPPFFPVPRSATGPVAYNVAYSENAFFPDKGSGVVSGPISVAGVPVQIAATASSAALGFGASEAVAEDWELAYGLSDLAVPVSLTHGRVQHVDPDTMTVADVAAGRIVRLADGGPVDNSGVAQVVSALQRAGTPDGWAITAIDAVEEAYPASTPVGVDIANLFGQGLTHGKYCVTVDGETKCLTIPDVQIFEAGALDTPHAVRRCPYPPGGASAPSRELIVSTYAVTTVTNEVMGVDAGGRGILSVLSVVWPSAGAIPASDDFSAYDEMFRFVAQTVGDDFAGCARTGAEAPPDPFGR